MRTENQLERIIGTITLVIVISVITVAFLWPFEHHRYCDNNETLGACSRDWLAVIVSFATFVGGVVAAWIVYKSVSPINGQLAEMRKQTAFIIGDQRPSLEIWTNNGGAVYRFRIVNWNRRPFLILKIRWNNSTFPAESVLQMDREEGRSGLFERSSAIRSDGTLDAWFEIEGWEDRSKPPEAKRFWQKATTNPVQISLSRQRALDAQLEVTGILCGEERSELVLRANIDSLVDLNPKRGQYVPMPYHNAALDSFDPHI